MHYYKVRAGLFAAHREDPSKAVKQPWISPVGYVEKSSQGWIIKRPCGLGFDNHDYPTQDEAAKALERHSMVTVARATWMK